VRINESGSATPVGEIVTLAVAETAWLPNAAVFSGLPPEVSDASPSGFIGGAFAARHPDLGLPARPRDWSAGDVLHAVSRRGDDFPGNLIVGEESLSRWFARRPRPATPEDYPAIADSPIGSSPAGSWIGGERPKFGAYVDGRHVLVKCVGQAGAGNTATQRWRDLLALEALALDVLREGGMPAARAQLFTSPTHKFLEIERFDRVGERGRRATMTLAAVHKTPLDTWAGAATRLLAARLMNADDARRLRLLDAFGALIANVDRHHDNVALFPRFRNEQDAEPAGYVLAPAFDQVPMLYAPAADGLTPARDFVAPSPTADTLDVWEEARAMALQFWRLAADAASVSDVMRGIARTNAHDMAGR
jgi:hypothetical protein